MAQNTAQGIPERFTKEGEASVPEKDQVPLKGDFVKLYMSIVKFLLRDDAGSKKMRAHYYPIINTEEKVLPPEDVDNIIEDKLASGASNARMGYFAGEYTDTYAYTSNREKIVFNRFLCEAYEMSVEKNKNAIAAGKETTPEYYVLTYEPIRLVTFEKIARDLVELQHQDCVTLPEKKGESGWFVEYMVTGGLIDIVYPKRGLNESESDYNKRKYKEVTGIHLLKYEKNADGKHLDVNIYDITLDALKRHTSSLVLEKFKDDELTIFLRIPHFDIIKAEEILPEELMEGENETVNAEERRDREH